MEMTARKRTGLFKTDGWKRFKKNKLALVGTAVICVMILAAVFAPVITQHDPYVSLKDDAGSILKNASPRESGTILGTDSVGRDEFSRLVYAARVSLSVGLVSVGISTVFSMIGAITGAVVVSGTVVATSVGVAFGASVVVTGMASAGVAVSAVLMYGASLSQYVMLSL